jgi:hypothetical protein
MLMAFNQFLMDRMFRPFFVGRMANNAPSRRVVSEARAKPGFQLVPVYLHLNTDAQFPDSFSQLI